MKSVSSGEKHSDLCLIQVYSPLGNRLEVEKRRGKPIKRWGHLLRWGSLNGQELWWKQSRVSFWGC